MNSTVATYSKTRAVMSSGRMRVKIVEVVFVLAINAIASVVVDLMPKQIRGKLSPHIWIGPRYPAVLKDICLCEYSEKSVQ